MTAATRTAPDTQAAPATWLPPSKPLRFSLITAGLGILGVASVMYAWQITPFNSGIETTDNAYVRGRTTVIAPQVSGYVTAVAVHDYQDVRSGMPLVQIDSRIYEQRVAQAQANLDAQRAALANNLQARNSRSAAFAGQTAAVTNAQAQLARAQADMARVDDLVKDGAVSQRERDQTFAALKQAEAAVAQAQAGSRISQEDIRTVEVSKSGLEAQVEAAEAQLKLAQIDLANTLIRAPETGRMGEVGVRLGQYVTNGTQLVSLVPDERWVIANYKESQTARMRPGQPVTLRVDGLGGIALHGRVEQISPAAGSEFSAIKADNGTGNFVKVPQRIGVRILVDARQPMADRLRPGMSIEARVDTRAVK